MKKLFVLFLLALPLLSLPAFSQSKEDTTELLGLPGDNLDLYAVLDLFQKSKTIEAFEKSLNDEKTKINNIDLNLDKKIDFIKVTTKKSSEESYSFILQVDVTKTETQDVAVILLDKNKDKKISLQIVGDENIYGKDYVIEPKGNSPITPNPAYSGENPVTVTVAAPTTTTVVVESAPIVQYVYSPAYVPYYPPYYYGYYPPWFGFATVMAVGIYRSNHWGYHGGYHGGHYGGGNTVIINNNNNFNNYNNNKQRSNTVANNKVRGDYGTGSANRGRNNNPSASTRESGSNRGNNPSASTRESGSSNRGGNNPSASNRQSSSTRQTPSASTRQSSNYSSPSRSSGGGGRSMGGGGGSRGGGGGRRF